MARPTIHTAVFARRLTEAMADAEYNTYTLAERLSLTPSTISRYMNGLMQPKMTTLQAMAGLLDVNPDWLMGQDAPRYRPERVLTLDNILLIDTKAAPLLGTIAAGEPIMAVEDCDSYIPCTADCGADFALRVKETAWWAPEFWMATLCLSVASPRWSRRLPPCSWQRGHPQAL